MNLFTNLRLGFILFMTVPPLKLRKKELVMLKRSALIILMLLASASLVSAGTDPNIQEGEWKITVNFEIPGMPMKMPPNTYTQCIKKDQPVPKSEKPNQVCEAKDIKVQGNTVTWSVTCTNRGGKMTGKGVVTYEGDKMEGKMTMTMEGQGANMVSEYQGVRIGDCK